MSSRVPICRLLPAISLAAVAAAWASSSWALSVAEIANLKGPDRAKIILEGAKKEGTVLLYTGRTSATLDAFAKKYPFLRLETRQGSAPDHVRRMTEEYAAGVHSVDIVATSNGGLHVLKNQGMLQPFYSSELASFRPESVEPGHHWATNFQSFVSLGFNTKEIDQAVAPKTLDDLLDPRFKGKLVSASSTLPNWIGAVMREKGDKAGEAYLKKLGQNQFRVFKIGGRALANLIVSGEVAMSPSAFSSHISNSKSKGAAVAWRALGGVYANVSSVALAKYAPHPYAAMFYIDYLLSKENQLLSQELGYSSGRKDIVNPDQPDKQFFLGEEPDYAKNFQKWLAMGKKYLGKPISVKKKKSEAKK